MTTTRAIPRRYVAADFAPNITERQADMLLRAVLGETRWGSGFGPLGVDLRTYGPLIDRGLLEEVAVDRGWGLGRGAIACATGAGRIALVRHLRDCDHGDIAHAWLIEWVGEEK